MPRYPYRQIGVGSPKQFRNDQNKNLVDIAADIGDQSEKLIQVESDSKSRDDATNKRVDNIVINASGDSNAEVVDARVAQDGTTYDVLKDRLDSDQQKVASQLADEVQRRGDMSIFRPDDNSVMLKIKNEFYAKYINVEWFGAIPDANFRNPTDGNWYKDQEYTQPSTDSSIAILSAIQYSYENGLIPIFIPGRYLFNTGFSSDILFSHPNFFGINQAVSGLVKNPGSESDYILKFNGGSGYPCWARIIDLTIMGDETKDNGIVFSGVVGMRAIRCTFDYLKSGGCFINERTQDYTEFDVFEMCKFNKHSHMAIYYSNPNGVTSFHGSGIIDAIINELEDEAYSKIQINPNCLPYNAPLSFTIWKASTKPIIYNANFAASFYGIQRVETGGSLSFRMSTGIVLIDGGCITLNSGMDYGNAIYGKNIIIEGHSFEINKDPLMITFNPYVSGSVFGRISNKECCLVKYNFESDSTGYNGAIIWSVARNNTTFAKSIVTSSIANPNNLSTPILNLNPDDNNFDIYQYDMPDDLEARITIVY